MTTVDYLAQSQEPTPEWLKYYYPGAKVDFKDFMSSRVAYYPGCGYDFSLIAAGGRSGSVHSFLYVDYGVNKSEMEAALGCLSGYHRIGHVDFGVTDLVPSGIHPLNIENVDDILRRSRDFVCGTPFCFMEIFESIDRQDRIAVTVLFADGVATYYQLFPCEYHKSPYLMLLADHGFGGNYTRFGEGGLLDDILKKNGHYPEIVMCAPNTHIWEGYVKVEDVDPYVGGMHRDGRSIYVKSK